MIELPDFIGNRLKPLATPVPAGWRLWQYKSLNLHRGVLHLDATATPRKLSDVSIQVRDLVREHYRPAWWRGFGFGVVISLSGLDDSFKRVADLIDVRNNSKGTWQWIVLHFPAERSALGVCTWTEGYLAPVYQELLSKLRSAGFACESHQKDMDAFVKSLVAIHKKLRVAGRVLGSLD